MNLLNMLTEFLFEKGYRVTCGGSGIKVGLGNEKHAWIRRAHSPENSDIMGLLVRTFEAQGTMDWEWYEIGNIHSPDFLDRLIEELDKWILYDRTLSLPPSHRNM